jgi:hypothetical protein
MTDDDPETLVTALAQAAGLPIGPEHMRGVAENLQRLMAQARIVMQVELPLEMEPAAIFRP